MTVFALFFGAFLYERGREPVVFAASRHELTLAFGVVNTVVLLTSSLLVALAVQSHRAARHRRASRAIGGATLCALAFVMLKAFEWGALLSDHLDPATNHFFAYYFGLTGLHLLHLVLGTAALLLVRRTLRRPAPGRRDRLIVEGGATYWHMVDLLWVVIFPLVYFSST
jgi:nitric oxide reductase NorE protein